MKHAKWNKYQNPALLIIAFITGVLLSPKWTIALAAWIYYPVLLRFYRDSSWKGYLVSIPVLTLAAFIAQLEVMPLGMMSMLVFMLVGTTIGIIPFLFDRLTYRLLPGWLSTLIFPTFFTLYNYFIDMGPQGTWSNIAYTQYQFLSLMQVASITGIYGINFLLFWFASSINYYYERRSSNLNPHPAVWIMPIVLILSIGYGIFKLSINHSYDELVKVSTITMDNLAVSISMYEGEFGKSIDIPKYVSQSDPILLEAQKGLLAFMGDPDNPKFADVYSEMDHLLMKYVEATREVANAGARIITWSEGAIINIKSKEDEYAEIAGQLADELDVYLFFPTAVFHPEKVGKEDLFIENKVLTFDPKGQLLNTYFKNIPIFGVEPSFSGDGTIPVIETPYGNLSPIICYDADHPDLIRQVSGQPTDMLVVPTGDWRAISPYHTYMSAVRCIENGVSMLKSTSNGLSAVIDDRGRILSGYDYFDEADVKKLVYNMSIKSSKTVYSLVFPVFIMALQFLALLILVVIILKLIIYRLKGRINAKKLSLDNLSPGHKVE